MLKLRRNRGLMAFTFLLTTGAVVVYFGYGEIRHASDPAHWAPAGGIAAFNHAVGLVGLFFGSLAAILLGTEAGTADLSSGVFRDLVTTGRSRRALFAVRAPAAIFMTLAFTLPAYLIAVASVYPFAGGMATPDVSLLLQSVGWIVLANAVLATVAVGVGSLSGSRALTLTAVIGWQAIVSQLLMNATSLGSVRDGLLTASLGQLMPVPGDVGGNVVMGTGVAVAVLAGWVAVTGAAGAWRTIARDA